MLCGVADRLGAREPDEVLEELLFGFLGTQLLYVVATLGIADLIDGAPRAVEDLAARTDVDPDVLYRYLRALASFGVFAEVDGRAFAQTPTSLLLRQDSGSGWNEFAVVYGSVYRAFAEALPVARDGGNMFERARVWVGGNGLPVGPRLVRLSIERCKRVLRRESACLAASRGVRSRRWSMWVEATVR
jgi:hypothetical protein